MTLDTIKISQLPQNTSPNSGDEIPVNADGVTKKENPADLSTDWSTLDVDPTLAATYGNRSFSLQFSGVDYTGILSPGMRLRTARSVTPGLTSADFDGSTQYASKASASGITFTPTFTAEAWVYVTSYTGGYMKVISRNGSGVAAGWFFGIDTDGTVTIRAGNNASNLDRVSSYASVPRNRWVHIGGTITTGTVSGSIWINGVQVPSFTSDGTSTTIPQSGDVVIGASNGSADYFKGRIREVRLWNTTRTTTEILDNMNQELTGSETGLQGYWKLAGDFNDSTSNGNNLTAAGAASALYDSTPFNVNAYAIVVATPVYSSGNTTVTVQAANEYPIPNETLDTTSYATVKAPFGFPLEKKKWAIITIFTTERNLTTSSTTTIENMRITVPVGSWLISSKLNGRMKRTTGTGVGGNWGFYDDGTGTTALEGLLSGSSGAASAQPFEDSFNPIPPYPYATSTKKDVELYIKGAFSELGFNRTNDGSDSYVMALLDYL